MINEIAFIEKLKKHFRNLDSNVKEGIGDDAAIVRNGKNSCLIYTCDSQVEDVHFIKSLIKPKNLGKKAISAALSDIAAMGGKPLYLLISLFFPKNCLDYFINELNQGIKKASCDYGVTVIGGNISKSEKIIVDVFAIGEANRVVTRKGAQVGDAVCVTGVLGNASSFLLKKKFYESKARITEGKILANYATSMIDLSDGLSTDLLHLCDASSVGVEIFEDKIPKGKNSFEQALNGGEDYELCFTIPKKDIGRVINEVWEKTKTKITAIGTVIPKEKGGWIIASNGEEKKLEPKGWDHLK